MPILYIIAGPNGAGKTTSAESILPGVLNCIEFVNADFIAKGISPYNPDSVAIQAGRIMLTRINELMTQRQDFVIETTLSTLSYARFIEKCKQRGYEIVLVFVWLNDPRLAKKRVKQRVEKGGHDIPPDVIERRYYKGLRNLNEIFLPLCNKWLICDNSDDVISLVARKENNEIVVFDRTKYKMIYND